MQLNTTIVIMIYVLFILQNDIAGSMVSENGKTMVDAIGDITRGIEVVEHCLAMPSLMMGESMEQVLNVHTETLIHTYTNTHRHRWVCLCMYICVCVCMYTYINLKICKWMYKSTS